MANGLPRESIGHYIWLGQQILVELNPNILVMDAIRMYSAVLYIIVLCCIVVVVNFCNAVLLYCTVLYCTVLYGTVL